MTVEEQIAALDDMSTPELAAKYEELHGKPPRCRYRRWLQKRIAYRIQEIAYGGLSMTAKRRLEELIAELDLPFGDDGNPRLTRRDGLPAPGTTIVKEWRNRTIRVEVLDVGFEWNNQRYKSLSAVARAITGTKWNGWLFFGLVNPQRRA